MEDGGLQWVPVAVSLCEAWIDVGPPAHPHVAHRATATEENKNAGRLVAIRHFDCRSAAKTELCVTVSEFFKPRFLSIPRA
jgi:hypothetical protein